MRWGWNPASLGGMLLINCRGEAVHAKRMIERILPRQRWGLHTALDVVRLPPARMRQRFAVVGERIVRELRGERCHALERLPPPKQTITVSRSFGDLDGT
jgi:hypothetical protein